jgi:hypothetical protein
MTVVLGSVFLLLIAITIIHIVYTVIADKRQAVLFYEKYIDDSRVQTFKNTWIHYVRPNLIDIRSDNEDVIAGRFRCHINTGNDDWEPSIYPENWHPYEIDNTRYASAINTIWIWPLSSSFEELQDTCGLGKDEVLERVSKLLMTFHEMGLWSVFAIYDGLYYEFTISRDDVVVYVPDWDLLDGVALEEANKLKRKATRFFDRHWFAYKLRKPYDLG